MKPFKNYLQDVLLYIADIRSFTTQGKDFFTQDRKTQLAVIRAYEVIGELVKRLHDALLEQPFIPTSNLH